MPLDVVGYNVASRTKMTSSAAHWESFVCCNYIAMFALRESMILRVTKLINIPLYIQSYAAFATPINAYICTQANSTPHTLIMHLCIHTSALQVWTIHIHLHLLRPAELPASLSTTTRALTLTPTRGPAKQKVKCRRLKSHEFSRKSDASIRDQPKSWLHLPFPRGQEQSSKADDHSSRRLGKWA